MRGIKKGRKAMGTGSTNKEKKVEQEKSDSLLGRRAFLAGGVAALGFAALGSVGCSTDTETTPPADTPATGTTPPTGTAAADDEILEIKISENPYWHHGNPEIEMNPLNPDNLVFCSTATTPWDQTWHFSMANALWYSEDRGKTWTQAAFPFGVYPGSGVTTLSVDSEGTFYTYSNSLRAPDPKDDRLASRINPGLFSYSKDGGKTWAEPLESPFVTTGHPGSRVDKATGKFYAVAAKRGQWQLPMYVSVTSDLGKTWSEPQRFKYPTRVHPDNHFEGFPGNNIAVHAGILATTHQESLTDPNVDEFVRFTYSLDDGVTWENLPVQVTDRDGNLVPVAAADTQLLDYGLGPFHGSDPLPYISADPSKEGRFAILLPRDLGKLNNNDIVGLEVYVTEDIGKTWIGYTIVATDACRPWVEFSNSGVLGVMWRTHHVHCFAAVSFDHGATFSQPLRFDKEAQPVGDSGTQSDYWSRIAIDEEYVHVGWADCRTGGALSAIYGRAPLTAFKPVPPAPIPLTTRVGTPLPHVEETQTS
jgi:hypothetical protein